MRVITIACWLISAVSLLGLSAWLIIGALNSGFAVGNVGHFQLVSEYSISVEQVDSLYIDWTSGAVTVRAFHGDKIQISEFARHSLREGEQLSVNAHDGTVGIYFTQHRILRNNMPSKRLEVLIPYALSEHLDYVHVNNVAGRIEVHNISTNTLKANTTSGRVELHTIFAEEINVSTMSGRIELFDIRAGETYLHSVSGRVVATNTEIQNIDVHATSGRVELFGSFENINARSISGRIEIMSRMVPDRLIAHATSGRISITVPNEGEPISVQYQTSSGRFTSRLPVITHAEANAQFNFLSTSGRIKILKLLR